jgi:hypothetical protein
MSVPGLAAALTILRPNILMRLNMQMIGGMAIPPEVQATAPARQRQAMRFGIVNEPNEVFEETTQGRVITTSAGGASILQNQSQITVVEFCT